MIKISQAQDIINKMGFSFDTHDFIEMLSKDFEREYVAIINKHNIYQHIFQSAHASIGKYLSENADTLNIKKTGTRESSRNIKGYKSPNQKWVKL